MSSEPYENDNKVVKALEIFGNIFALNVFFILFSLPVVTIGASTTALYTMMLKMIDKKESAIWKGFVTAFKSNFKRATQIWLIVLAISAMITGEVIFVMKYDGSVATFYTVLAVAEGLLLVFALPFLFPLVARYENTLWNTLKNAFLLTVSHFWSALKILLGWGMPIILSVYYPITILYTWWAWLIFVFGLIAYCTSFTLRKVFRKVEEAHVADDRIKALEAERNAAGGAGSRTGVGHNAARVNAEQTGEESNSAREGENPAAAGKDAGQDTAPKKNYHRSHREIMREMAEQNAKVNQEEES